ncbi:MAG: hemerythrin domain-containing protein [Thermoplasmata archaeon]
MEAREDLFTSIHKGLRAMIYNLSSRLQTNDFANLATTKALASDLEYDFAAAQSAGCILCIFSHHATDEEKSIFNHTDKVARALTASLIADHHELTRRELELTKSAHQILEMGSADDRVVAGVRLNADANELFATYLGHMNREETELMPLMHQHFTDAEIVAMARQIIGGLPPERMMAILSYMLPSLNVSELSDFVGSMRETAPPPVAKAVTELAAVKVDPARWAEAKSRLGM